MFASCYAFSIPLLLGVASAANSATVHMSERYGDLPLQFEENRGQADATVRFTAHGAGYGLYLTAREAVLVLAPDAARAPGKPVTLRTRLVGASAAPAISGAEKLPGKSNYFIGRDASKWRTGVPAYRRVRYNQVYPGIDLVYYGKQRQLEYDFIVAPRADPERIALEFTGAKRIEINAKGDLLLHTSGGTVRQHRPLAWQETAGARREIGSRYVRRGATRVGFELDSYDRTRPVVIDPVISYSTFLGGSQRESVSDIAIDADGNAYVTGLTTSTDFPVTAGALQPSNIGFYTTFVSKLDATGSTLLYSTYIGGNHTVTSAGIAIDASRNIYVAGTTFATNFPTTAGAMQTTHGGGSTDGFVSKLDATGATLLYSTFVGGSGGDSATGPVIDANGNAYVTGTTSSPNFHTTNGSFQPTRRGSYDAFVMKLNAAGTGPLYSTLLGGGAPGTASTGGNAIALDALDQVLVTGTTNSTDFPTTAGAFQTVLRGAQDVFVTKFDATGDALIYSTYLGGHAGTNSVASNNYDGSGGIATDAIGNAYVVGTTSSTDFPVTTGALQTTHHGVRDAFVVKFGPTGALNYATYLGGSGDDNGTGIAAAVDGSAFVTGRTESTDLGVSTDALQPGNAGYSDAFVSRLNPAGSGLLFSTYLGGSQFETPNGIALDGSGNAYLVGISYFYEPPEMNVPCPAPCLSDFPTTAGAFQQVYGGGFADAFIVKIAGPAITAPAPPVPDPPVPSPPVPGLADDPRGGTGALAPFALLALGLLAGARSRRRQRC